MIYSYLDTLLDKWVEWSEGFLSKKLENNISDINSILGTSGSDNPTRANEFYKIGLLKLPLTGSNNGFDLLRKDSTVHTDFGYLSFLIRKAQLITSSNSELENAFKALSTISLIQQSVEYNGHNISLNHLFQSLLVKFPIPMGTDEKSYFRYLSAAMFCELDYDRNSFVKQILADNLINLRLIEVKSNNILVDFKSSSDIIQAVNNKTSLGSIRYTKGSTFFIGNHKSHSPRGLFYQAYSKYSEFLSDHFEIEKNNISQNLFDDIYLKNYQINIFTKLNSVFKSNQNYLKLMKSLEQGCIEALNTLKWGNNITRSNNSVSGNTIFYGAPGTGKSYKVNQIIASKLKRTERVTFHPEYDYASFVGGYKPKMDGNNIKYDFVPQAFTNIYVNAWNDPDNDYYLVIEEINRGNCAEIFGDIFQLLDRDSDYDITPSIELEAYLTSNLKEENKGLENGKLKLPDNLTIYATMNTSDQSLFPMDSAFKRRWDWEYIPICYEELTNEKKTNPSYNYIIDLGNGESFKWNEFISKVNLNHIQQNPVLGMDKCMGNYFVKPKKGETTIDVETFINKAIFYLWNDVFKDEKNEVFEENSSYEDFFPIKTKGVQKLKELLERIEVNINTTQEDTPHKEDEVTN